MGILIMDTVKHVVKRVLPRSVVDYARALRSSRQIELKYLETHLTDHCNLNCKGCGHRSPLSPERFADFETFRRDIIRLRELFSNIQRFRLMGGEPLLHPRVSDFLRTARAAFPRSNICLVTNGILLTAMPQSFWEKCARDRIVIDLSLYPIKLDLDKIKVLSVQYRVPLHVSELITHFLKFHRNLRGDSDPEVTFRACRRRYYCPFLDRGRIYVCGFPALAHLFSERFQVNMPVSPRDFISIHDNIGSRDVIEYLESPIPLCRYCTTEVTPFEWARSRREREEWLD